MSEFEPLLDADSVDAEDVDLENASRPARQKNAKWTALKCTLCIVVSVGLLALAIATSLPVVLQKKGRSEPRPEPGSSVRFAMDVAVNPCENFYAAACGSISAMSKAELRRHHDNMFFHSSSPTSFNDIEYSRLALFRGTEIHLYDWLRRVGSMSFRPPLWIFLARLFIFRKNDWKSVEWG